MRCCAHAVSTASLEVLGQQLWELNFVLVVLIIGTVELMSAHHQDTVEFTRRYAHAVSTASLEALCQQLWELNIVLVVFLIKTQ
eukprot:gene17938-24340_t